MTDAERQQLLDLARGALTAAVEGRPAPRIAATSVDSKSAGVFVTVHVAGDLRGCLGSLDPHEPLAEATARLAADVARHDYRFAPLRPHELSTVGIEISVLTRPDLVVNPVDIVVGRDGLIVEQGKHRGLLLPQVATEHGWDRDTLLAQTCVKAGLPADAWQRGASVYRFQAEVFGGSDDY